MSPTAAATTRNPTARFTAFLAGAVILHGMLLLLPAQHEASPGDVLHRLTVSLRAVTSPPPESVTKPIPTEPPPAQPESNATERRATLPADVRVVPAPPDSASAEPDRDLTTARLLDHANRLRWPLPEHDPHRNLGEPLPGRAIERPGEAGPAATIEIMDRWLAPDGSHNVLIRTASGDLLCGRADAWDPLRPLVEPVMTYRNCGSAGPTFEWPDRYRARASRPR